MKRFLMHFPIGVLTGVVFNYDGYLALGLLFGFCFYEFIQDWRKRDNSYKDVIGFVVGLFVGGVGILIWLNL